MNQAIRAWGIMHRDQDYVVKDGEVIIVDEFTGRLMYGRRYNEGLHQAIEAKEGVEVARESKTLATITFQNYFRLYDKLSGMTGTAMTEQEEFSEIYKLDVVEIPTNRPMIREDCADMVYKTQKAKFDAVIEDIVEHHQKGQPVLVGTITIEKSEMLSKMLKQRASSTKCSMPNTTKKKPRSSRRRAARGCNHRHQHGWTRHRYSVGRQRGIYGQGRDAQAGLRRGNAGGGHRLQPYGQRGNPESQGNFRRA